MKVLFFFKSGDLLLLKSGEIKFANYSSGLFYFKTFFELA